MKSAKSDKARRIRVGIAEPRLGGRDCVCEMPRSESGLADALAACEGVGTRPNKPSIPYALPLPRHDPPHRPAADALDAGDQLRLPSPAIATIVVHT
jgi:hypothetical protein